LRIRDTILLGPVFRHLERQSDLWSRFLRSLCLTRVALIENKAQLGMQTATTRVQKRGKISFEYLIQCGRYSNTTKVCLHTLGYSSSIWLVIISKTRRRSRSHPRRSCQRTSRFRLNQVTTIQNTSTTLRVRANTSADTFHYVSTLTESRGGIFVCGLGL